MSLFKVEINFEKSKLPKNILKSIAKVLSVSLQEDIDNVSGSLVDETNLHWRENSDPIIFITIQTVQNLNAELNQKCVSALSQFLTEISNIPIERIFIYFMEKVYSDVAINGLLLWQCM